jgi:DNA invertase Pin-like site-specific DNA recombinase
MQAPGSYLISRPLQPPVSYISDWAQQVLVSYMPAVEHWLSLQVPVSYTVILSLGCCLFGLAVQESLQEFGADDDEADSEGDDADTQETEPEPPTAPSEDSEPEPVSDAVDEPSDSGEPVAIYTRVSTQQQVTDGHGIDTQIQNLRQIVEDRGFELATDPITDKGETGTDFDRPGIQKTMQLAVEGKISYLLVDDIDRVGRHAIETIYYLYELRSECDVLTITPERGVIDFEDMQDKITGMMDALSGEMGHESRMRKTHDSCKAKFERKNWSVFYDEPPLGYRHTDDDWLEIDESEVPLVEDIFETFIECDLSGAYSDTAEQAQHFSDDAQSGTVKRMLKNSVYIGQPSVGESDDSSDGGSVISATVIDDSLQIISESTFNETQEKIDQIAERYGTADSAEVYDVDRLMSEFGIARLLTTSPILRVHCPICGSKTVKNGTRFVSGQLVHNYLCKNDDCSRQRVFPNGEEWEEILS